MLNKLGIIIQLVKVFACVVCMCVCVCVRACVCVLKKVLFGSEDFTIFAVLYKEKRL